MPVWLLHSTSSLSESKKKTFFFGSLLLIYLFFWIQYMSDISLALFTSPLKKFLFFCFKYKLYVLLHIQPERLKSNNSLHYVFYLNIHNNVYINDERSAPAGRRDDDNSAQRSNKAGKKKKKIKKFSRSHLHAYSHIYFVVIYFSFFFSTQPRRVESLGGL